MSKAGINYGIDTCYSATDKEIEQIRYLQHRVEASSPKNFLDSAKNGNVKNVKKAAEEYGVDLETKSKKNKQTALMVSSANNHFEVVDYLLRMGANVNARDIDGVSALHLAAEKYHLSIMKILISNGANIKKDLYQTLYQTMQTLNDEGQQQHPFQKDAIELLKKQSQLALLPLGHLFNKDVVDENSVLRLLEAGETELGVIDSHPLILKNVHNTLLSASKTDRHHFIRLLLQITHSLKDLEDVEDIEMSVNIDSTDDDGMTALMWSALKGHEKVTKLLLDNNGRVFFIFLFFQCA
jgi:ankyrin repeat protein